MLEVSGGNYGRRSQSRAHTFFVPRGTQKNVSRFDIGFSMSRVPFLARGSSLGVLTFGFARVMEGVQIPGMTGFVPSGTYAYFPLIVYCRGR